MFRLTHMLMHDTCTGVKVQTSTVKLVFLNLFQLGLRVFLNLLAGSPEPFYLKASNSVMICYF